MHSWRVAVLPFIEESLLLRSIDLDQPWDSEGNAKLHELVPHGFKCHSREDGTPFTQLFAVSDRGGFWTGSTPVRSTDIKDPGSHTLVLIELDLPGVNWMSPTDISLDELLELLESHGRLPSPHPAGVQMAFASTAVRCVPHEKITAEYLRAIVSIDGNEDTSGFE